MFTGVSLRLLTKCGWLILFVMQIVLIKAQDCVDGRMRAGKCTTLAECPEIIQEFYDAAHKYSMHTDFQTFVSSSICGFEGNNFLICCTAANKIQAMALTTPPEKIQETDKQLTTTTKPFELQLHQTTPFVFAPLSGYMPQTLATASSKNASDMLSSAIHFTFASTNINNGNTESVSVATEQTPSTERAPAIQPITEQTTTATATTQAFLISQVAHQPINTDTCGVNRATVNRVVGGNEARKGSYPWMAALGYRDVYDPSAVKYLCAGSLISPKYVISSAHCINNKLTVVRLGAHDLENGEEPHARNYYIKRTVIHDEFDLKTISNDLALIELNEPVIMTKFINTICLPEEPKFLTEEFVNMHPFLAGWGAKQHQGPTSNVLRDVQVPIISRQECEQSYRTIFKFVKFSKMLICAGNSVSDACQGDSGGPLMLPQLSDSTFHYYLIGVVSYGYECARTGFPGVYTKVASYMPWIKRNII